MGGVIWPNLVALVQGQAPQYYIFEKAQPSYGVDGSGDAGGVIFRNSPILKPR